MTSSNASSVQIFGSARSRLHSLWCHAKITPAALHRGNFGDCCRGSAEAAGGRSKFFLSDFLCVTGGRLSPVAPMPLLAPS
jgi:hypothetical protein